MTGGDDDTPVSLMPANGQFGGRCGRGQPDVDNLVAHADESSADDVAHHRTGNASVAPDNDFMCATAYEGGKRSRKLDNIQRIEGIARRTTYGSTYTRN